MFDSHDAFPIERSNYLNRLMLERIEVDKVKWVESEKAGHDIGYYRAQWIWISTFRRGWVEAMRASGVAGF